MECELIDSNAQNGVNASNAHSTHSPHSVHSVDSLHSACAVDVSSVIQFVRNNGLTQLTLNEAQKWRVFENKHLGTTVSKHVSE